MGFVLELLKNISYIHLRSYGDSTPTNRTWVVYIIIHIYIYTYIYIYISIYPDIDIDVATLFNPRRFVRCFTGPLKLCHRIIGAVVRQIQEPISQHLARLERQPWRPGTTRTACDVRGFCDGNCLAKPIFFS